MAPVIRLAWLNFTQPEHITPLAQITVVDAREGDCCLVDFCRRPLNVVGGKAVYADDAWIRTLIDTGPSNYRRWILATLKRLITKQSLPDLRATGSTDPFNPICPPLSVLQITHSDDDHVGNSGPLVKALDETSDTRKFLKKCEFQYADRPVVLETPQIIAWKPIVKTDSRQPLMPPQNEIEFQAVVDESYRKSMARAGINVKASIEAEARPTLAKDGAVWGEPLQRDGKAAIWLSYQQTAINKFKPAVKAHIILEYADSGEIGRETKSKRDGKKHIISLMRPKGSPGSRFQIPLGKFVGKEMSSTEITIHPTGDAWPGLSWKDPNPPKRAKTSPQTPHLFLNALGTRNAEPSSMSSNMAATISSVPEPQGMPITVMTVEQMEDLWSEIYKAEKRSSKEKEPLGTKIKEPLGMKIKNPVAGYKVFPKASAMDATDTGIMRILGPSEKNFQAMMRSLIQTTLKHKEILLTASAAGKREPATRMDLDSDIINRASIVTMFERNRKVQVGGQEKEVSFTASFTGDAYDQGCDIRETLYKWSPVKVAPVVVDVLKVPHHGSERTTEASFFANVHASVYIICGSIHGNVHGNPKLSTLKAIIESFKGRQPSGPPNTPFRIFFSCPKSDTNYTVGETKCASPVKAILADQHLKPWHATTNPTGEYKYEMWKLANARDESNVLVDDDFAACGSIAFSHNAANELLTQIGPAQWVQMK